VQRDITRANIRDLVRKALQESRGNYKIVAKLFNLVLPEAAVFGLKDYQQAAVVRRMTQDLNFPVKIVLAPTVREPDGLAMSSRNRYLSGDERRQAAILSQALQTARARVRQASRPLPAATLRRQLERLIATCPAARVDYIEFFDPATLEPKRGVSRGAHMALAVYVGKTRLIDNGPLA
jgi:pantoate--beta-alanine ligase